MDDFSTISWDNLRFVLAIERAGSLRGGARALGVNHSTVIRRLTMLEEALGARLFDRTPDGYLVTQAGEDVVSAAKTCEAAVQRASRQITGTDTELAGRIRINIPPALIRSFLTAELVTFSHQFPQIELDIDASHSFTDLARREADVTLRMDHRVDDDVVARKVIDYAKAFYVAADLDPDAIARLPVLGWAQGRTTLVKDGKEQRHFLFSNALQLEFAARGAGRALLPCFLGDSDPRLRREPDTDPVPGKSIWVVYHADLRKSARLRAFVDFIVAAIKRHRPLIQGHQGRG